MSEFEHVLSAGAAVLLLYTYGGYPLLLILLTRLRKRKPLPVDPDAEWPPISNPCVGGAAARAGLSAGSAGDPDRLRRIGRTVPAQ